jgi:hypothetical protein
LVQIEIAADKHSEGVPQMKKQFTLLAPTIVCYGKLAIRIFRVSMLESEVPTALVLIIFTASGRMISSSGFL